MNRSAIQIFVGFSVLVALTAGLLFRFRGHYVQGKPGVRIVQAPIYNEESNLVANASVYLPETIGEFRSIPQPVSKIEQQMLPPDTMFGRRVYFAPDRFWVNTSVVLMGTDRTSIHKPQFCLRGQGETIQSTEVISIPIARPAPYELKVMKLGTTAEVAVGGGAFKRMSGVFLYWFVADGQLTPHHGERMWWMARDMLTKGVLQRWAYVSYFARCEPGMEAALLERMKRFVSTSVPEFQTTPPAAQLTMGKLAEKSEIRHN